MIAFLKSYQTDIMLGLASICLIIALFTALTRTLPLRRKLILLTMEICSATWLFADRVAYIYHGVSGEAGYYAVRISNFLVFLMTVVVLECVNLYMEDVLVSEGGLKRAPVPLLICDYFACVAAVLVIVSQFTGLYYTFDETNTYHRSGLYFISFLFPYSILILMFVMMIVHRKRLKGKVAFSLYLFVVGCISSSLVQLVIYGISWMDMMAVIMVIVVYLFAFLDLNERVEAANRIAINHLRSEQESMKRLFSQTAGVLAVAIDAKDPRTRGSSARVASYAKEIARVAGYDEKDCDEIYYTALLHDVGKISLSDAIVSDENDLTEEESVVFKKHADMGVELLSGITEYPFLKEGARSHHERYDGQGYPEGLKGEEIPVAARIVAVADFYDSMTSRRIFNEPLPQRTVREEILKGAGTEFDPDFVKAVVELIDADTEYQMRVVDDDGNRADTDLAKGGEMHFGEYKEEVSDGIKLSENEIRIQLTVRPDKDAGPEALIPAIVLFDSYDGCTHNDDRSIRALNYLEYAEIWFDGHVVANAARNIDVSAGETESGGQDAAAGSTERLVSYTVTGARFRDHVRLAVSGMGRETVFVVALPDAARFAYMGIAGEHCTIRSTEVAETGVKVAEGDIPRIAEEVSFIDRVEGDIPNVQIEGYRSAWTEPVPLSDGMRLVFHTMSLPTANLIWHCPFILVFSSDDGKPDGPGYRELACIRLDGENATYNGTAQNDTQVNRLEGFDTWDTWKKDNKNGYDCRIDFRRRRNRIVMSTENCGIKVKNTTTVTDRTENIFVTVTGDQCALTDIRVKK
jgi:hypothetical protein